MRMYAAIDQMMDRELRRFVDATTVSCQTVCEELQETNQGEHVEKIKFFQETLKNIVSLWWDQFAVTPLDTLLPRSSISTSGNYIEVQQEGNIVDMAAAARTYLLDTQKSYVVRSLLTAFGLTQIQARILTTTSSLANAFGHVGEIANLLTRYLVWLEVGSTNTAAYLNSVNAVYEYIDGEAEDEQVTPDEFYDDIRVRTYALLKATELDPQVVVRVLTSIDKFWTDIFTSLFFVLKGIASLAKLDRDRFLFMLVGRRPRQAPASNTRFETLHIGIQCFLDLLDKALLPNEGLLYHFWTFLNNAKEEYISRLSNEMIETVALLPTKEAQQKYIQSFERGTLWIASVET